MKKLIVFVFALFCVLVLAGCSSRGGTNEKPTNNDAIKRDDSYIEFFADIYLCDDVYRTDDTPTHGNGSIAMPMAQNSFEVNDYQILLCTDKCELSDIVSRASQGYAPAYQVVLDGEIEGNFRTFKFKMVMPEPMKEELKNQDNYEEIIERFESNYYYLLEIDENHYVYIHLERRSDAEKIEHEAELADSIIKNTEISLNLDKGD